MVCRQVCVGWLALWAVAVTLALGVPTSSRTRDDRATSWQKRHKIYDRQGTMQENNTQNEAAMAEDFLSKFGYFRKGKPLGLVFGPSSGYESRPERDANSEAIRTFQSYFGLRQTGQLDKDTLELMRRKRCGVPDIPEDTEVTSSRDSSAPSEYSVLRGQKWNKNTLTWRLEVPTPQIRHSEQRRIMREAFNTWRRVAPLEFIEKQQRGRESVDIDIMFGSRQHGDQYPFDGRGKVLAHAFGPGDYKLAGDMHLDNDERWTVDGDPGSSDLLLVAIHELGHSLGLDHSRDYGAIMYPFYGVTTTLGEDDIKGIQSLYGARIGDPGTTQRPRTRRPITPRPTRAPVTRYPYTKSTTSMTQSPPTTPPPSKGVRFDVVIQDDPRNRDVYTGIKGDRLYHFSPAGLVSQHPDSLHTVYPGAPINAEAVFTVPGKSATYFVKDNQVWRYRQNRLDTGFPKALEPSHFPETIRFVLSLVDSYGHRRVFVFGKTHFLEYNFDKPPSYSRRPSVKVISQYWRHVSTDVKYAVMGTDNYFYFVSPDSHVVLDGHRRAMRGGKQDGDPKWMTPAYRQIEAASSGASNLHSFGPSCAMALFTSLLFVLRK